MCSRVTHARNGSHQFKGFVVVLSANAAGRYSTVRVPLDERVSQVSAERSVAVTSLAVEERSSMIGC